ncbi:PAS domain-containing sensor histidine kinase [Zymomonas mobilis]|uniref:histidine kinase n=1 Tax=Zymomonas mobilis subsp. pomaceae (strain ATCC 29192 / DSM 22645 / JCM 10191 / CCUG 17912 / NBRC 13757 / NCIMB 11200 / NRRL B-4491 / Barker I) TaxID=579138 RepID=F8ETY2_ZYMMT|nr:HAMP domain-containing sensor histidine kinase [Zymomonas mobilis]AEI38079.1 histidine kinase [Zymomonas mobilis subsp. pomaceae ATCC 29192]MDX5949445.1 HAMP domain-containing sensor histidine kinase [Zymomonas mobilis subsp. pomaceae]GEB89188.1 hypothetical protein ZMO02_08250 [Zymomonas mobilis subsp. pomaceae]
MKINATLNPSVSSDKQKAVAILDSEDHLIKADNLIAALHAHNGGEKNAPLACAPLNRIIHLARRLQTRISRRILLVDINKKQDLWVEAIPKADGSILLEITGWAQEISSTEDSKIADNRIDHAISLAKKPISVRQEDVPVESKEPLLDRDNSENFDDETARWQWQADAHLNLTYFPPALEAMTGLDPDLYLHRPFARLFTLETDAEGRFPIMEALAEHHNFCAQPSLVNGKKPKIWLSGQPVFDASEKFIGFEGIITLAEDNNKKNDISSQRISLALPDRIDRSFKPPLHRIIENAEHISSRIEGPLRKDYVHYAMDIAAAGQHLMMLIDDLADLQEIESSGFRIDSQPVDLAEIAQQAIALQGWKIHAQNVKMDAPKSGEKVMAYADPQRVMQILLNLISNALRYSPEGASVWIRVEQDQKQAYLIIADQGRGIAPENQQRIFNKFERVNPDEGSGTGLGLFISRQLAHSMQGDITVDSAPGQGARFTLMLPAL